MKVTGSKKLIRSMKQLPKEVRSEVAKSLERSVKEGVRISKVLAPVDSGDTRDKIHYLIEETDEGLKASVEAAPPEKEAQIKARSIEFGRKQARKGTGTRVKGSKPKTGTTNPQPYIRPTEDYLVKKNARRVQRAVNKAAKRAFNG